MNLLPLLPEVAAAGAGTAAFAVLFHVPAAFYLRCGVIGGCGWLCYRLLMAAGLTAIPAVFCATVLVVFLSRLSAVVRRCPVTLFLVPGIFPLVPGVGIYWTAYYLVTEYGMVDLKGTATWQRAEKIISVAHPDFRDELIAEAEKLHIWRRSNKR